MTAAFRHDMADLPASGAGWPGGLRLQPEKPGGCTVSLCRTVLRGVVRVLAVYCWLCHATNLNKLSDAGHMTPYVPG